MPTAPFTKACTATAEYCILNPRDTTLKHPIGL